MRLRQNSPWKIWSEKAGKDSDRQRQKGALQRRGTVRIMTGENSFGVCYLRLL